MALVSFSSAPLEYPLVVMCAKRKLIGLPSYTFSRVCLNFRGCKAKKN